MTCKRPKRCRNGMYTMACAKLSEEVYQDRVNMTSPLTYNQRICILHVIFSTVLYEESHETSAISLHQQSMAVTCIPLHTPLVYSKTGVYWGIPGFRNFAPKHRLWVLV